MAYRRESHRLFSFSKAPLVSQLFLSAVSFSVWHLYRKVWGLFCFVFLRRRLHGSGEEDRAGVIFGGLLYLGTSHAEVPCSDWSHLTSTVGERERERKGEIRITGLQKQYMFVFKFDFLKSGKRYPTRLLDLEPNLTSLFMHFKHSSNKICSVLNYLSPYFKDSAQTRHHVQSKYGVCVILVMFGVFACVRVAEVKDRMRKITNTGLLFFFFFF